MRIRLAAVVGGEVGANPAPWDRLGDVEALAVRYACHIEYEEKELLPMAARLLSDHDLARIGRAMRERRGIDEA